ncbi:MAG: endonuclease VII domain-containing protein [Bacteroidales bacterium]|nr:endonuclease VII domain-containing protein [Bacteroidales bacterium]
MTNQKQNQTYYQKHKDEILKKSKERYADNKENRKEYQKKYYHSNIEKERKRSRQYHALHQEEHKIRCRKNDLKRKYSITLEQYNKLYGEQNGCCKICGRHSSKFKNGLAVDHNHRTGKIRGLLCNYCNRGLGKFSDSLEKLEKAVEYLKNND